jgi:phospholipase D1/2
MKKSERPGLNRKCHAMLLPTDSTANTHSTEYIRFYHLRVYDRINAPMGKCLRGYDLNFFLPVTCSTDTLIARMEANSGVKFSQAQVALARQWVGDSADPNMPTEVAIKLPEPTLEGIVLSNKTEVKSEKYPLPRQYSDAVAVIEQFERGASAIVGRRHDAVADTVGQHALQDETELRDEQWLGSEEEELNSYVFQTHG